MRTLFVALGLAASLAAPTLGWSQKPTKNTYQYTLDLAGTTNDRVPVRLVVPPGSPEVATFNIPQVIPGTYADYDFGRFIHNFKALDAKGNELPVTKPTPNTWEIRNAKGLTTITYEVEDTWDTDKQEQFVFEVGGSNIEKDSVWVVNNGAFFGYLNDWKRYTYDVTVKKPTGFYGSTSLTAVGSTPTQERFVVPNYMDLVDAPFLYSRPDTTWLNVGGAKVLISVYSKTGRNKSAEFREAIAQTLEIQRKYLGGTLPVDKYAFLIYLNPEGVGYKSGLAGALEHSYSSLYALFEGEAADLAEGVKDIAAHEFFHIVTPLTVHAEEIGDFDYINPKMSKHLWMYEGATEYFAQHALAQGGVTTPDGFLTVLRQKMVQADRFGMDGMSFTEMSRNVLNPDTNELFGNVYAKGALIAMGVDLQLRANSNGEYSLIKLMGDLGKVYGKDKSFKDDQLFDEIMRISKLPSLKPYFLSYVEGTKPLPMDSLLRLVGINYQPSTTVKRVSLGVGAGFNQETGRLQFTAVQPGGNGELMGLKAGDELVAINGTTITMENIRQEFTKLNQLKAGETLSMTVVRGGEEKTVSAQLKEVDVTERHQLSFDPNATPQQLALRKNWLNQ